MVGECSLVEANSLPRQNKFPGLLCQGISSQAIAIDQQSGAVIGAATQFQINSLLDSLLAGNLGLGRGFK
jgi:hypothetical protein